MELYEKFIEIKEKYEKISNDITYMFSNLYLKVFDGSIDTNIVIKKRYHDFNIIIDFDNINAEQQFVLRSLFPGDDSRYIIPGETSITNFTYLTITITPKIVKRLEYLLSLERDAIFLLQELE